MGKKRRIKNFPQKFGRKFASHPYARAIANLEQLQQEALADGVVTPEEQLEIAKAQAAVESLTPILDAVAEELVPEPMVEDVAPEPIVEEPIVEEPVAEEKPKPKRARKATAKKATTKRKYTRKKKAKDKE